MYMMKKLLIASISVLMCLNSAWIQHPVMAEEAEAEAVQETAAAEAEAEITEVISEEEITEETAGEEVISEELPEQEETAENDEAEDLSELQEEAGPEEQTAEPEALSEETAETEEPAEDETVLQEESEESEVFAATKITVSVAEIRNGYRKSRVFFKVNNPDNERLNHIRLTSSENETIYFTSSKNYDESVDADYYIDADTYGGTAVYNVGLGVYPDGTYQFVQTGQTVSLTSMELDFQSLEKYAEIEPLSKTARITLHIDPLPAMERVTYKAYYKPVNESYPDMPYLESKVMNPTAKMLKSDTSDNPLYHDRDYVIYIQVMFSDQVVGYIGSAEEPLMFHTTDSLIVDSDSFGDKQIYLELLEVYGDGPLNSAMFDNVESLSILPGTGRSYKSMSTMADDKWQVTLYVQKAVTSIKGLRLFRNLSKLTLDGLDLTELDEYGFSPDITYLNIQNNEMYEMPDLTEFTRLETLYAGGNLFRYDTVTADKLPSQYLEAHPDALETIRGGQRFYYFFVPQTFYEIEGHKPFFTSLEGAKPNRKYLLTVKIEDTEISVESTTGNGHYAVFIIPDLKEYLPDYDTYESDKFEFSVADDLDFLVFEDDNMLVSFSEDEINDKGTPATAYTTSTSFTTKSVILPGSIAEADISSVVLKDKDLNAMDASPSSYTISVTTSKYDTRYNEQTNIYPKFGYDYVRTNFSTKFSVNTPLQEDIYDMDITLKDGTVYHVHDVVKINYKAPVIPAESVTVTNKPKKLTVGAQYQLNYTVKPANTSDKVTFRSGDPSVATVSDTGLVTTHAEGTVWIYVNAGSKARDSFYLTVADPVRVTGIRIYHNDLTFRLGSERNYDFISAEVIPEDAENQNFVFESSNESVVTIKQNGLIQVVGEGSAVITATSEEGGYTDAVEVTVLPQLKADAPYAYYFGEDGRQTMITEGMELPVGTTVWLKSSTSNTVIYNADDQTAAANPFTVEEGENTISVYAGRTGYLNSDTVTLTIMSRDDSYESDPGDVTEEDAEETGLDIPEHIWAAGVPESVTYTGSKITFSNMRVYDNKKLLKYNVDYTVKYLNNQNAGTAEIQIKGKGNYSQSISVFFEIEPMSIEDAVVNDMAVLATGAPLTPVPKVVLNGKTLKKGTDYTVNGPEGVEIKDPGTYQLRIEGINNYQGYTECLLTVGEKGEELLAANFKITPEYTSTSYDGSEKEPSVTVKYGTELLTEDTDYEVTYENNEDVGTASIIVTGMGRYIGTKTASFKINGTPLKNVAALTLPKSVEYRGDPITFVPEEIITPRGDELNPQWIDVSYLKNTDKGTATVVLTGTKGYTGTVKKTFKITAKPIAGVTAEAADTVYAKKGAKTEVIVKDNDIVLKEGVDYTLTYKNNKKVGKDTANVIIKGKGNYSGSAPAVFFDIDQQDISGLTMTVADVTENTKPNKFASKITITDLDGGVLKAGTDYAKTYVYTYEEDAIVISNKKETARYAGQEVQKTDVIPAGTAIRVKVTGINNYSGELSAVYRIAAKKQNIGSAKVTIPAQTYTGRAITLNPDDIKVVLNKQELTAENFEIVSYAKNINKGTATVVLKGIGAYAGTKKATFKIGTKQMKDE